MLFAQSAAYAHSFTVGANAEIEEFRRRKTGGPTTQLIGEQVV